ncbi:hypothetical protein [Pedobacter sp. NJ-S-72]
MKGKATKFIALGAMLLLMIPWFVKDKLSSHDDDQKNAINTINITEVKDQFYALKIQKKLTTQFNAQIKMSWLPKWEIASRN